MLGMRWPYVALCCPAVADMHVQPSSSEWWSPLESEHKTKGKQAAPSIIIILFKRKFRRIK